MREIKFRAWDIAEKKMMYRDIWDLNWYGTPHNDEGGCHCIRGITPDDIPQLELMQFTGLKDKNGKEIYEGDIVKNIFWKITDGDKELSGYQEVVFNNGGFYVRGGFPKGLRNGGAFNHYPHSWEIIGNIYENPALLNQSGE